MANGPAYGERVAYGADDVCYRHPRVHSFTLCQRCGRTICPDCQQVSAVGVLCPDCVKQTQPGTASRAARTARVTGRRFAALDTPVTYAIIGVNLLTFVLQLLGRWFFGDGVTQALWYAPLYSLPSAYLPEGFGFEPWRMLTAMFTHDPSFMLHIVFNMLTLWMFGRNLEQLLGRLQYFVLYLFAGLGGSLFVMLWVYADPMTLAVRTVGASGAIFGVMAATAVVFRKANVNVTSLVVLLAINFGLGLMPGTTISWQAHLGGMIVGALCAWVMSSLTGPRRRGLRIGLITALGAVLLGLSFAYFVALPPVFA